MYNEFLLKGKDISMNLQNMFMYSNSILVNLTALAVGIGGKSLGEAFAWHNLRLVFHPLVVLIILNSASMGIVTSMFLKHLSSVLKVSVRSVARGC